MAAEGGRDSASLKELLIERTGRFEFLQAVRLFQKIWSDRAPVGLDGDPHGEVLRFHSDVSSVFPSTDVREGTQPDPEGPGHLTVSFLGVAVPGAYGALPRRYAEELRYQARNKNRAPLDFFDIFNHRFISLFYRTAAKNRLVLAYESGRHNMFERALYAVLGLGTDGLRGRLALDEQLLAGRAGLLAMRPMPASALASALRSLFQQPVVIEQFLPARYEIEVDEQNRLSRANSRLGHDLYLGAQITLVQSKFRVRLGPLTREAYHEFLPDRLAFRSLMDVVRLAVEEGMDFDLQLVMQAQGVAPLRMGEPQAGSPRLGWTSWLMTEPFEEPADDACFVPASAVLGSTERAEAA